MDDYLNNNNTKKLIEYIDLDTFSVEDLDNYIEQLEQQIDRVKVEKTKKIKLQEEAKKFFK